MLTVLASQLLPLLARLLAGPQKAQSFPVFWRNLREDAATAVAQVLLSLTFLAYHAWETVHAIGLTLVRLAVTKRRLLEWETAAAATARAAGLVGRRGLFRFSDEMMASPFIAAVDRARHCGVGQRRFAGCGAVPARVGAGAGRRLLAQPAGRPARASAHRRRADAPSPDGAQNLAVLRNLRDGVRRMAAA